MSTPELPPFAHQPQPYSGPSPDEILRLRKQFLNPGIFLYYKKPLTLVEGKMQYVWDETGRRYLDALGGIVTISVGHCHPDVVAAANKQNELLQHSTTIYLHPNIAEYAEALAAKMPGDLKVCYFVNSGSEANDLALLMARAYTGNYDVIALRNAYHGGNASGMGLTAHGTWKFNVPHSFGVHHAIAPDPYRGVWGRDDAEAGKKYAADVKSLIEYATSGQVAAFIAESIQGVGGCVVFPNDYLKQAYEHVRAAGGVCIADEVQAGFGRTGTHYWGFETQGVIPDIVTMAKGIGNGAPLGAVVTTPKIAAALQQRIHFNTFGGNPVVCAQGKAVLEVIDRENLQANSLAMGKRIADGLVRLKEKHQIIGDTRGKGLMLGIELVKDRATKEPAKAECAQVVETCRDLGLLLGKGGLQGQTIRFSPPMCIHERGCRFRPRGFGSGVCRLVNEHHWMHEAVSLGRSGMLQNGGGPFGAVVVCDGKIVGRGCNQVTSLLDPTAHAEIMAIRAACQSLRRFDLRGCELFTSCEPCPMCLAAIYWARLDKVYYACTRHDAAAIGFDDNFIYEELPLEIAHRSLPMEQVERESSLGLFRDWLAKPDRVPY